MAIDDNTSYELTGYQVKDLASKVRAKADSSALASVATSGLYSDLTGAPTIPTVYNGTLTIQQDGTTLGTFSANQSTNETINITGGGGGAVTYYIADGDPNYPQTLSNGFVYEDAARTTKAEADDIYADIQSGKTVYLEYRTGPATDHRETMFAITSMTRREIQGVADQYDYFGSMTSYMDGSSTATPATFGFSAQGTEPITWQFVKQYIPTVNNATLTIQQNGTNVQTFTANSSTNKTANIDINNGVLTAWDLVPTADTTAGWRALFPTDGHYVTVYSSASSFSNKPTNWGVLTTDIAYDPGSTTSFEIFQIWRSTSTAAMYRRNGNHVGWYNKASDSGSFTMIYDQLSSPMWRTAWVASQTQAKRTIYLTSRNTCDITPDGQGGVIVDNLPYGYKMVRFTQTQKASFSGKKIGIRGLKASTSAFNRFSGISAGTTKNWSQYSMPSVGSNNVTDAFSDSFNSTQLTLEYTCIRCGSGNEWTVAGTLSDYGANTHYQFSILCEAKDNTTVPNIFFRGTSSSDFSIFYSSIEILQ